MRCPECRAVLAGEPDACVRCGVRFRRVYTLEDDELLPERPPVRKTPWYEHVIVFGVVGVVAVLLLIGVFELIRVSAR